MVENVSPYRGRRLVRPEQSSVASLEFQGICDRGRLSSYRLLDGGWMLSEIGCSVLYCGFVSSDVGVIGNVNTCT